VTQTASSFSTTTTLAAGEAAIGANSGLPSDVGDAINNILQNNHADEGQHGTVIQEDTLFVHKVIHENNHYTAQPVHHIVATTIHAAPPPVWTPPPVHVPAPVHTPVVQIHAPPPAVHTPQVLYPAHTAVILGTPMVHTMIVDPLAGAIATPVIQNAAAAPTPDAAAAAAAQAGANLAPPAVDLNAGANLSPAPVDLNAAAGANLAPAVDLNNAAGANLAPAVDLNAGANLAPPAADLSAGANLAPPAADLNAGANLAPAVDLNAANAATINLTGARNVAAQPPAAGAAAAARRAVDNIKRSIGFSPAAWASHVRREAN
jgi:hypothetical protein